MKRKTMKRVDASGYLPPLTIRVVKGKRRSRRALHELGLEINEDADAMTASCGDSCTVCMIGKLDAEERDATAVHEAVHCAQAWLRSMIEDEPGDEEMAYMVEACYRAIREQL